MEHMSHAAMQQQVLQALQARLFENHGMLRRPQLQSIAEELIQLADPTMPAPTDIGRRLNQHGLALSSVLHATTTLLRLLIEHNEVEAAQTFAERLAEVIQEYHRTEFQRIRVEQQQIQEAARVAMVERDQQAERLQAVLHELSTPIVPVYRGILIVPLIGGIDTFRSNEITARLLDSISQQRAIAVIIDITGVPVVDTGVAKHLLQTTQAARLLGTDVFLVGMNREVALTLVQLGIDMTGMVTLSNLEQGLAHALRRQGLVISPLPKAAA